MTKVLRFKEHDDCVKLGEEFIQMIINPKLNEKIDMSSSKNDIQHILKNLSTDLKFNYNLVFTFGAGIKAIYPIVDNLIRNGNLNVEITKENIVLLSLAAIAITYLEEKNNKVGDNRVPCDKCDGIGTIQNMSCKDCDGDGCDICELECKECGGKGFIESKVIKSDMRTILEELKLNGIVKKLVKCFTSIGGLFKILFKNTPYLVSGFMDMFAYTSILIPTMNAVSSLVGNYNLNMDTLPGNLMSVGIGVTTFLAKNGLTYLINKLKGKFNIKINPDLEKPTVVRSYDIADGEVDNMGKNKLIKEQ